MREFIDKLQEEMARQDRLDPDSLLEANLISVKVALQAGIEPEMIAKMLRVRLELVMKLVEEEKH